ncbi:MAG: two-component sensor histidine kinase, partial [Anaerotignum sp.]|nr:two-component sensor histidine kinase [Anaerotignum sp.]
MTNKIFKAILSVAMAILMASLVIITGVLYQYFGGVQVAQLKDELSFAANATEQLGEDYLKNLDSDRYRLTLVGSDGEVVFDSHADAVIMENHGDREEIREAFISGTGSSTRKSATLTEQTIYEATRLDDGSVLRISVSRATAVALVLGMLQPITMILVIAIALSAWLAHRMAKRVVDPLNKLDLEKPMENEAYEELSPLL